MVYAAPAPVILVDASGNGYSAGAGAGGGALDASFQQVTANGALGALNANLAISVGRRATLTLHVTGTWVGTISLQGSLDGGTTWVTINAAATWIRQDNGTYSGTIGTNAIYQTGCTGLTSVRVAMTSYTSGSANVYLVASDEPAAVALDAPLPTGSNTVGAVTISGTPTIATVSGSAYNATTAAAVFSALMKATAGNLFELDISNTTGSPVVVKLYDKTTAPAVGTDIPVLSVPVAAGVQQSITYGQVGKRFASGISIGASGLIADSDTTAPAAGVHISATYV